MSKPIDQEREAFEAWYAEQVGVTPERVKSWRKGDSYDEWYAGAVNDWGVWQARAAAPHPVSGEQKADNGDAFYAGLYHKSSPMWYRLHNLAVSKGYDHVQFAIECAPVYKCDCMGSRKVAIDLSGKTVPCECASASNDSEPPAAQDVSGLMKVAKVSILRQSLQQATLLTKNRMLFVPVVCDTQEEWERLQAASEERMNHYLAVAEHIETGSPHPGEMVRAKFEAYGKAKGWVHVKRKGDGYSNTYINCEWEAWQARGTV